MNEELSNILVEAMDVLTPKQREAWKLVMQEGLSFRAAARKLSPSPAAIRDRVEFAKIKLTQEIERIKSERGITNE